MCLVLRSCKSGNTYPNFRRAISIPLQMPILYRQQNQLVRQLALLRTPAQNGVGPEVGRIKVAPAAYRRLMARPYEQRPSGR